LCVALRAERQTARRVMAPAGTGAAVAAVRKKKREEKMAADNAMVNEWFQKYDASKSGSFAREEMKKLLTAIKQKLTKDAQAAVTDKNLDRVMTKYANEAGEVPRAAALKAVQRYKALLEAEHEIRDLFARADKDHSGLLPPAQLKLFLEAIGRLKMSKNVSVTKEDVDFILEQCDVTQDGSIDLNESEAAMALWLQTLPEKKESSMCSLL